MGDDTQVSDKLAALDVLKADFPAAGLLFDQTGYHNRY